MHMYISNMNMDVHMYIFLKDTCMRDCVFDVLHHLHANAVAAITVLHQTLDNVHSKHGRINHVAGP